VFISVPVLQPAEGEVGTYRRSSGTALLLTEDCQLDKPGKEGEAPRIPFLQFTPIISIDRSGISPSDMGQLKKGWVNPPGLIYLDDVGGGVPGIADLGQAYPVASSYFELVIADYGDHPEVTEAPATRARPRANGQRDLTMTKEERDLFHQKLVAYWTHQKFTK
jgi:hypothetical protein